jgi:hypothetical protein
MPESDVPLAPMEPDCSSNNRFDRAVVRTSVPGAGGGAVALDEFFELFQVTLHACRRHAEGRSHFFCCA